MGDTSDRGSSTVWTTPPPHPSVTVAVDPEDRRGRRLSLTEAGRAGLAAAVPVWRATHAAVEATLGGHDADMLRTGLRALA